MSFLLSLRCWRNGGPICSPFHRGQRGLFDAIIRQFWKGTSTTDADRNDVSSSIHSRGHSGGNYHWARQCQRSGANSRTKKRRTLPTRAANHGCDRADLTSTTSSATADNAMAHSLRASLASELNEECSDRCAVGTLDFAGGCEAISRDVLRRGCAAHGHRARPRRQEEVRSNHERD